MIDMVVHRHDLRETLSKLCRLLLAERKPRASAAVRARKKPAPQANGAAGVKLPATADQLAGNSGASAPPNLPS
jgi:acetyl-CoA carboxylase carboxyl transferase subunit beta